MRGEGKGGQAPILQGGQLVCFSEDSLSFNRHYSPMKSHEFDNSGSDGEVPTAECQCGATVPLHNSLENTCPECDRTYNGFGQRLRDGTNRRRTLAQERGRDPGVGPPGHGA